MRPAYSMTGFASVAGEVPGGMRFTLSMKSVNHRYLDMQFRLPLGCDALEIEIRRAIKERLRRGHIAVTLQVDEGSAKEGAGDYNREAAARSVRAMRAAAKQFGLTGEPTVGDLLRMPGVWMMEREPDCEALPRLDAAVREKIGAAIDALQTMRAAEGAALVVQLRTCMEQLEGFVVEVDALRDDVRSGYFEKMRQRIEELTADAAIDPGRILAEAAVMAERSDVEEEIGRLRAHGQHFTQMLEGGGELGKKLDFLLQELNREANTLLSKTGGIAVGEGLRVTELGLDMKAEIERARELVQNIE